MPECVCEFNKMLLFYSVVFLDLNTGMESHVQHEVNSLYGTRLIHSFNSFKIYFHQKNTQFKNWITATKTEEVQLKARVPESCCTTKNEKYINIKKTNAYPPHPGKTQLSHTSHIRTHPHTHTPRKHIGM